MADAPQKKLDEMSDDEIRALYQQHFQAAKEAAPHLIEGDNSIKTAQDIYKQIPSSLTGAAFDTAALPRTMTDFGGWLSDKAAEGIMSPKDADLWKSIHTAPSWLKNWPTSEEMRSGAESLTGPLPNRQPETTGGQYADTIARSALPAALGPIRAAAAAPGMAAQIGRVMGGVGKNVARGAMAGAGSELAGQSLGDLDNTPTGDVARAVGATIGSGFPPVRGVPPRALADFQRLAGGQQMRYNRDLIDTINNARASLPQRRGATAIDPIVNSILNPVPTTRTPRINAMQGGRYLNLRDDLINRANRASNTNLSAAYGDIVNALDRTMESSIRGGETSSWLNPGTYNRTGQANQFNRLLGNRAIPKPGMPQGIGSTDNSVGNALSTLAGAAGGAAASHYFGMPANELGVYGILGAELAPRVATLGSAASRRIAPYVLGGQDPALTARVLMSTQKPPDQMGNAP